MVSDDGHDFGLGDGSRRCCRSPPFVPAEHSWGALVANPLSSFGMGCFVTGSGLF